jgi:5-methylthioadenosine/S-adenosylhomocysteine deaminase
MTLSSYALVGDVVTMNHNRDVIEKGVVYVRNDTIEAVQKATDPAPHGFESAPRLATGGTIFPGLIELHNHLAYNILPMWRPPRRYGSRDDWRGIPDYRKLIMGPMEILVKNKRGYKEAIVRYVECKCLLGGVTTSQGLTLSANAGLAKEFTGIVRNPEYPDDAALPPATAYIADVATADDLAARLERARPGRLLLHVAEGVTEQARKHFLAFQRPDGSWAITDTLVGIHCTALDGDDWKILARGDGKGGGAMVWSPLSNLMLYGKTAGVRAARAAGVRIALGSDWSPSGSKSLLWELKIAYLYSKLNGGIFTEQEIVEMATIRPAEILGWDKLLGSLAPGRRADLLVIAGSVGDPYKRLLRSEESSIKLVAIRGVPRVGVAPLMAPFGLRTEAYGDRLLYLDDPASSALVGSLTLAEAQRRLSTGMKALPDPPDVAGPVGGGPEAENQWSLVLDQDDRSGAALRPLAPLTTEAAVGMATAAAIPVEDIVEPMTLDPLTVSEDAELYLAALDAQPNVPAELPAALRQLQHRLRHAA